MSEWISVDDELPIYHEDVIAATKDGVPVVAYIRVIGTWNDSENHCELNWEPTHWMPLPDAPK